MTEKVSPISQPVPVLEDSPKSDDMDVAMAELSQVTSTRDSPAVDQRRNALPKKLYRDTDSNKRRTTSISTTSRQGPPTTSEYAASSSKVAATSAHPEGVGKVADSAHGLKKAAKKAQREARRAAANGEVSPAESSAPPTRPPLPPVQWLEQQPAQTTLVQPKSTASQPSPAPSGSSITTQPSISPTSIATQSKPEVHVVNLREADPTVSLMLACPSRINCVIGIVVPIRPVTARKASLLDWGCGLGWLNQHERKIRYVNLSLRALSH